MKKSSRVCPFLVLGALTAILLGQEQRRGLQIIELPSASEKVTDAQLMGPLRYAENGLLAPEVLARFVALDLAAGSVVLRYPANLGAASRSQASGKMVTTRVTLSIGVLPSIAVTVEPTGSGVNRYRYTVGNAVGASQDIGYWVLGVPSIEGIHEPDWTRGWGSKRWACRDEWVDDSVGIMSLLGGEGQREKARAALVKNQIKWFVSADGGEVKPGGEALFQVESENLPGLVTAYFQGFPSHPVIPAEVPNEIGSALPAFNFIETNSVTLVTLGPKFPPDAKRVEVAADYLKELEKISERDLLPGSRFVTEASTALRAFLGGDDRPLKQVGAIAGGGFEKEIYQNLLLALARSE